MKEFTDLLDLTDTLLGPNGCPWDQEQTFESLRKSVVEEVYELVEAVDEGCRHKILEELGDLAFNFIFFCKLGEKEGAFSTEDVLKAIYEKLVRRHPHVFGEAKISTTTELIEQWERIKSQEKGNRKRKSLLDGIPKDLPSLAKAQKMLKKFDKVGEEPSLITEDPELAFGSKLFEFIREAQAEGIDAEAAFRHFLQKKEHAFRKNEDKLSTKTPSPS